MTTKLFSQYVLVHVGISVSFYQGDLFHFADKYFVDMG